MADGNKKDGGTRVEAPKAKSQVGRLDLSSNKEIPPYLMKDAPVPAHTDGLAKTSVFAAMAASAVSVDSTLNTLRNDQTVLEIGDFSVPVDTVKNEAILAQAAAHAPAVVTHSAIAGPADLHSMDSLAPAAPSGPSGPEPEPSGDSLNDVRVSQTIRDALHGRTIHAPEKPEDLTAAVASVAQTETVVDHSPQEGVSDVPQAGGTSAEQSEPVPSQREPIPVHKEFAPYGGFFQEIPSGYKVRVLFDYVGRHAEVTTLHPNGLVHGKKDKFHPFHPPEEDDMSASAYVDALRGSGKKDKSATMVAVKPLSVTKRLGNKFKAITTSLSNNETDPEKGAERRRKLATALSVAVGTVGAVTVAKMGATAIALWLTAPAAVVAAVPIIAGMAAVGAISYFGHYIARYRAVPGGKPVHPPASVSKLFGTMAAAGAMGTAALFAPTIAIVALGAIVAAVGAGTRDYLVKRKEWQTANPEGTSPYHPTLSAKRPSVSAAISEIFKSREAGKAALYSTLLTGAIMGAMTLFTGSTVIPSVDVPDTTTPPADVPSSTPVPAPAAEPVVPSDAAAPAPTNQSTTQASGQSATSQTTTATPGQQTGAQTTTATQTAAPQTSGQVAGHTATSTATTSTTMASLSPSQNGSYTPLSESTENGIKTTVWEQVAGSPDQSAEDAAQAAFYDIPVTGANGAVNTPVPAQGLSAAPAAQFGAAATLTPAVGNCTIQPDGQIPKCDIDARFWDKDVVMKPNEGVVFDIADRPEAKPLRVDYNPDDGKMDIQRFMEEKALPEAKDAFIRGNGVAFKPQP